MTRPVPRGKEGLDMRPIQKEAIGSVVSPQAARLDRHRGAAPGLARGRHGLGGRRPARDVHQVDHDVAGAWPASSAAPSATAQFSGTVIDYAPGPTTTLITAIYHFEGSRHDFTARMHVEQTGLHAVARRRRDRRLGQGQARHRQLTTRSRASTSGVHAPTASRATWTSAGPPATEPQERRAAGRTALPALGASAPAY